MSTSFGLYRLMGEENMNNMKTLKKFLAVYAHWWASYGSPNRVVRKRAECCWRFLDYLEAPYPKEVPPQYLLYETKCTFSENIK
jgi:hypothetical protein